jgi:hypothetical protein
MVATIAMTMVAEMTVKIPPSHAAQVASAFGFIPARFACRRETMPMMSPTSGATNAATNATIVRVSACATGLCAGGVSYMVVMTVPLP